MFAISSALHTGEQPHYTSLAVIATTTVTLVAYRRGEMMVKRQALMVEWSSYCTGTAAL